MAEEEAKLKAKINQLIDQVQLLDTDIMNKTNYLRELEENIEMLQIKQNASGAQEPGIREGDDKVSFVQDFCLIAGKIFENQDYIKYNYTTANSEFFYKVEKSIFDDYICKFAQTDIKTFLNFCVDYALVKSDKNRKCTYNSGKLTVYYVSKPFMEASAGRRAIQEKVC